MARQKKETDIKKTLYGVIDDSVVFLGGEDQKQIQSRIDELVQARPFIVSPDYFTIRLRSLTSLLNKK